MTDPSFVCDERDRVDALLEQREPLWKTRDGRLLYPLLMNTRHIENALAMLKRKGYIGPSTVSFYLSCPLPHGDRAMDAFDMEYDAVLDAPVSKFVDIFESILKQRREARDQRRRSENRIAV